MNKETKEPKEEQEKIAATAQQIAEAAIRCCHLNQDAEEMGRAVMVMAEESFETQAHNYEKLHRPSYVVGYAMAAGDLRWRIENYLRAKYGNITIN